MAKASKRSGSGSRSSRPRASQPSERMPAGVPESILRAAQRGAAREEERRTAEREASRRAREEMPERERGRPIRVRDEAPETAAEGSPAPAAAWSGHATEDRAPARERRAGGSPSGVRDRGSRPDDRRARGDGNGTRGDGNGARSSAAAPSAVRSEPPAVRTIPAPGDAALAVEDLRVFYGAVQALKGISFHVRPGETVAIIGSNGAGKTTTLKTVSGVSELLKTVRGRISILGQRVESWPAHKIARLGVAHSPEGRKVFPNQTVRDNLMLGAYTRSDAQIERDIAEQYERFPILGQRRNQPAGLMSGGEQQMLAMARALMSRPKIILLDEPSMGLAPLIVKQIFDIIEQLKSEGKTILLVEQMAFQALGIADRAYVLETGSITMEGTGKQLLDDPRVKEAYLGA